MQNSGLVVRLVLIAIVLAIATIIVAQTDQQGLAQETYWRCCNNVTCTDTYYDKDNDECVLVLCQQNRLMMVTRGDNECRYPARK